MSKSKDPLAEANKVLGQVNANLERQGERLRLVGCNFVKRGDYTLAVIHAQTFDPVKPTLVIGYGMSKRHPEDESDRSVGYDYAFKRALMDVFDEQRKGEKQMAQAMLW